MVESYTWSYVIFWERCFDLPCNITAKMMLLITILDDTYDSHATIEECRKLNEAIQRWDESAVTLLPEYLEKFYMELLRTFNSIEGEMAININFDIAYLKNSIQNNVAGFLQEAEWSHKNHKPSFKDQVSLTSLTIGMPTLSVSVMSGMDDAIMKQALEWVAGVPTIVVAGGKIVRFMNDIAAFKRRNCKGDVVSSVECYVNEHSVTGNTAIARIVTLIEDEWRILNQARFENRALLPAQQLIIGLALSASLIYDNKNDAYTVSGHLWKTIEGLFVKPI